MEQAVRVRIVRVNKLGRHVSVNRSVGVITQLFLRQRWVGTSGGCHIPNST